MADAIDRTGASSGAEFTGARGGSNIDGYDEFRKALREFGTQWPKQLQKINKQTAELAANYAALKAYSMGGIWAAAAKAIVGRATQKDARVGVTINSRNPFAGAAFWGMKRRTGWFAAGKFSSSPKPQHPVWVGNTWEAARKGQGPYAINDALADHLDDILAIYSAEVEELMNEVLPPWKQGQMRRGIS